MLTSEDLLDVLKALRGGAKSKRVRPLDRVPPRLPRLMGTEIGSISMTSRRFSLLVLMPNERLFYSEANFNLWNGRELK